MAIAFSLTGLQEQCQAIATAIDSGDYSTARDKLAKAFAVLVGLPQETQALGAVVKMRSDLDKLSAIIDSAQSSSVTATSDRRRFIRTGLSHG